MWCKVLRPQKNYAQITIGARSEVLGHSLLIGAGSEELGSRRNKKSVRCQIELGTEYNKTRCAPQMNWARIKIKIGTASREPAHFFLGRWDIMFYAPKTS